jgi:ATP-dependent helicase/DNAse subunit B
LKHVLNLASAGEVPEELAGNQFGNLAHDVLQAFGRDPQIRDSARAEEIFAYLEDQLQRRVQLHYGEHERLAAVELQMEQLRARLLKFSQWQAARVQAGWRIVFTENTEEDSRGKEPTALFSLGNIEIQLKGRIDRIDRHEARNELAIFDYKTADAGEKPEKTHRKRDTWIDLQLPLYRHLAKAWGHEADVVRLGYILLPRSLELVGEAMADWSDEELLSADETASAVIRSIRAQEFWPPADPPAYPDDFTALCQDRRLGGRNLEE